MALKGSVRVIGAQDYAAIQREVERKLAELLPACLAVDMADTGAPGIYSYDKDFDRLQQVTRIEP